MCSRLSLTCNPLAWPRRHCCWRCNGCQYCPARGGEDHLVQNGLSCGILETAKALDKCQAHVCVLAFNSDEPVYDKLVETLCAEHQINLIKVDDNKKLGEWGGLCKTYREEKPQESGVVVKNYGKESQAKDACYQRALQVQEVKEKILAQKTNKTKTKPTLLRAREMTLHLRILCSYLLSKLGMWGEGEGEENMREWDGQIGRRTERKTRKEIP